MTSSEFWSKSKVAVRSGLFDKFWELPRYEQGWLIAYYDTQDELEQVIDWVRERERQKN